MNSSDSTQSDDSKRNSFFSFRLRLWGLLTAAGTIAAAASVAGFFGQFAWWLDIGSHFRIQYVAGFAAMAACYWLGRKKRSAIVWLCLCFLNAFPVIAFLFPLAGFSTFDGQPIKVILANVNTQTGNPQKVLAFLERENPDIVILEEINDRWVNSLDFFFEKYPIRIIEPREDNFGIVLLSRGEALTSEVKYFGQAHVPSIVADIRLNGHSMTVITTHPLPPAGSIYSELRNEQLELLALAVRENEGPVLLLGDLNMTPWSYHYRTFIRASGLLNSSEGRGIYPTWPTFMPLLWIPLDYALHTQDIEVIQKRTGPNIGSDHYPIIVDFAIRRVSSAKDSQ